MTCTSSWRAAVAVVLTVVSGAVLMPPAAHAAAPQVWTQAPGFYRMRLGSFEITALSDGTLDLPVAELLTNTTPGQVEWLLSRAYLASPVETSINAYLINTGSKLVLVDTGADNLYGPTLGRLMVNLQAAGYQPAQVDEVLITHVHADHVGGLMLGNQRAFPNATVRISKKEADYWLSTENMNNAPPELKPLFLQAMASLNPYAEAGRLKTFQNGAMLVPGIRGFLTPGHTPGHSVYSVESQDQKLVVWGDLLHVAAVQFPAPWVTIQFDSDSTAAAFQRLRALADATGQGHWVAAAHISFPGIGHVRAEGIGYVWIPANYSLEP